MDKLEKDIIDKANFYYTCKYNFGKNWKDMRECIELAVENILQVSKAQLGLIFGALYNEMNFDYDKYIDKIYDDMKALGFKE